MDIGTARRQHEAIIARLMRGPGDSTSAMHRAESSFGLSYWCQWNLRHKRRATYPFMERVKATYIAVIEKSVSRDLELLKIEKAKGADDASLECLLAEAETLLARIEERKGRVK